MGKKKLVKEIFEREILNIKTLFRAKTKREKRRFIRNFIRVFSPGPEEETSLVERPRPVTLKEQKESEKERETEEEINT